MVALKRKDSSSGAARKPTKQERRGGIETSKTEHARVWLPPKQERRGGIETSAIAIGGRGGQKKQERRGGIETELRELRRINPYIEAGTPWWH